MTTTYPKGISRRGWLRWTVILSAAAAIPGRVWAAVARPEAAFGATALDEALAALGDTPQVHEGIQFMTPDIAENGNRAYLVEFGRMKVGYYCYPCACCSLIAHIIT